MVVCCSPLAAHMIVVVVLPQRVRSDLLKTDLHETLLDYKLESSASQISLLQAITYWLTPMDKSLPTLLLRTTLYRCLSQLPGRNCLRGVCLYLCSLRTLHVLRVHSPFGAPKVRQDWGTAPDA